MNPRIAHRRDLAQHVARSVERVKQLGGAVDVCPEGRQVEKIEFRELRVEA